MISATEPGSRMSGAGFPAFRVPRSSACSFEALMSPPPIEMPKRPARR